jgi:hypothetical protein
MATKLKQAIATGTVVLFLAYGEGAEGDLRPGAELEITGFDKEDGTYNVKDADGNEDSLFDSEFEIKPEKAAKAAKGAKAKAEAAPAKVEKAPAKKTALKVVDPDEEDAAPGKGVVLLPKFKSTASVTAAVADAEGDYLAAASALAEQEAKTEFTLGGILAKIKRENLQATIMSDDLDGDGNAIPAYSPDLSGYNAYVLNELGLHDRKAHSLVAIYEKFSQLTTEAAISKVGWTKLRELLPLDLDKENVAEWLAKAKNLHTADLHESVRKTLVDGGGTVHGSRSTVVQKKFTFVAFEDQAEMWSEAIAAAKKVIGEDQSDSMALNHIMTEWMALAEG